MAARVWYYNSKISEREPEGEGWIGAMTAAEDESTLTRRASAKLRALIEFAPSGLDDVSSWPTATSPASGIRSSSSHTHLLRIRAEMASPLQESQPHDFMQEELTRALSEQAFGITSYEVLSSSPLKAVARVVLLENDTILVSLTGRGYQVRCGILAALRWVF